MRIHVLSDLHLEFGDFDVPDVEADVVLIAGDLDVGARGIRWAAHRLVDTRVLYVPGNHEFYHHSMPELVDRLRDAASRTNGQVTVLDRDSVEIDGVVFVGATLWTDFELDGESRQAMASARRGMRDYKEIWVDRDDRLLLPSDTVAAHRRDLEWLRETMPTFSSRRLVVITHHAPSAISIPPYHLGDPLNPAYASRLDHVVEASGAALWVHGHTHHAVDYRIGGTRVVSNPRGYTPSAIAPGFAPDLVHEV